MFKKVRLSDQEVKNLEPNPATRARDTSNSRSTKTLLAPSTNTYLHRLPGELRNRIYRHIGLTRSRIRLGLLEEPALAQAIPDFRTEIQSILLAENKLDVDVHSKFVVFDDPVLKMRSASRGDKHGAGKLAIADDSWLRTRNVKQAIIVRSVGFHIQEMGGLSFIAFFVNIVGHGNDLKVRLRADCTPSYKRLLANRLRSARPSMVQKAKDSVHKMAKRAGFAGLTWSDMETIAKCFEGP